MGLTDASRTCMSRVLDVLEPNNLRPLLAAYDKMRDLREDLIEDLSFVRTLWRGLVRPRPSPGAETEVFGPPHAIGSAGLAGKRIAVVSSGGSGATASLVGVQRAFEEAGIEPVMISACSGSVLFGSLWACGLSAERIAQFWLELPTADYVDPDWRALARGAIRRFRSTTGLMRGEAIERAFRREIGDRTLGQTAIPFAAVVWNIDDNRIEYLSTRRTPDLPIARVARIAISIPIMVAPVQIGDRWYADGGIVDIFPTTPLADVEPVDLVIGTNCYLPDSFAGMSIGDWYHAPWSILRASGQLRYAVYLELAREHARQLGDRLELLHPVPHGEVRGARFYETFLDRTRWPRYMRAGHAVARGALVRRNAACDAKSSATARRVLTDIA
jgi:NTE family protein